MILRTGSASNLLFVLLLFSPLVVSTPAGAQTAPEEQDASEAAARYRRGLDLYNEENYRGALAEFRKSYEITGEYRVLYNVAQVCYQLQDYVCAVTSFEKYLKDGGNNVSADRRQSVENEISKLRPRIATVSIAVNVEGASVVIDDIPVGKTPLDTILLSAGAHRVAVSKEGYIPISQAIEVAGAEKRTIRLQLEPAGSSRVVVRETERIKEPESQWTTLSYIGLGVGGALLVGGGVTGAMALSSSSKMEKEQYVGTPSDRAKDLQSDVQAYRLTSDILSAAGILTLGATLYFTLSRDVEPEKTPEPSV
ncbi:MAG TPA: PEGA domain-containing protein, partial [Polyangiaceae bacterium]|nr:PEGA domain-containing protein [Polyangiaceae bacterium]